MLASRPFYIDLPHLRPGSPNALLFAVVTIAAATALHVELPWFDNLPPFILFYPVVMTVAYLSGTAAGLCAALLATLAAWFFILPPPFSFTIGATKDAAALGLFAVFAASQAILIGTMRAALVRARQTSETLTAVFEANPDAILVVDRHQRIVRVNNRTVELFGHSRDVLMNLPIESLLPERFRSRHVGLRAAYMTDPAPRSMGKGLDLFACRNDGSEFPVDVQIGPVGEGDDAMVIAMIRDITEEMAMTADLLDTRQHQAILEERQRGAEKLRQWADAFENAAFGMCIVDVKTDRFTLINPAFAAMCGMSVDAMRDMPVENVHPPEEKSRVAALMATADRVGHAAAESGYLRGDGETVPVLMNITSVRDAGGAVLYRLKTAIDVTEQRHVEDQLRQAQKMEAIGNLTGGIAHDFNNLLGIVIGNLDLVRPLVNSNGTADAFVGEALEAALRGADLTRRLLAFARRQPLQPKRLEINELVAGIVKLLMRTLGENIEISLALAGDAWPIVADPTQLEASLVNLATNARDAMPQGGRLVIATGNRSVGANDGVAYPEVTPGDYAMIEVTDSGSGMTQAVRERIFEPFYTTKETGKGTGLGLSMVFGFIRQSGGHITVYSEVGAGTTFRLFLPRTAEAANVAVHGPEVQPASAAGETVLSVEDNAALQRVVVQQLRELGYRAIEADSAAAALTLLDREKVDLLFTDIVMPGGIDGVELARQTLGRWPNVKVLLTSGFPEARFNMAAGETRMRLLNKPYRKDDLARMLREVLDA